MISTRVLNALFNGVTLLEDLAAELAESKKNVVKAIQILIKRELVHIHAKGDYRITDSGRTWSESRKPISPGQGERPRRRTRGLRERAWWHFRAHQLATLRELTGTHANGEEADAEMNVYKYLCALEKAGVLERCARRVPARQSRGLVQWKLARDLGPLAPVWREVAKTVFDPNSDEVISIDPSSAVGPEVGRP